MFVQLSLLALASQGFAASVEESCAGIIEVPCQNWAEMTLAAKLQCLVYNDNAIGDVCYNHFADALLTQEVAASSEDLCSADLTSCINDEVDPLEVLQCGIAQANTCVGMINPDMVREIEHRRHHCCRPVPHAFQKRHSRCHPPHPPHGGDDHHHHHPHHGPHGEEEEVVSLRADMVMMHPPRADEVMPGGNSMESNVMPEMQDVEPAHHGMMDNHMQGEMPIPVHRSEGMMPGNQNGQDMMPPPPMNHHHMDHHHMDRPDNEKVMPWRGEPMVAMTKEACRMPWENASDLPDCRFGADSPYDYHHHHHRFHGAMMGLIVFGLFLAGVKTGMCVANRRRCCQTVATGKVLAPPEEALLKGGYVGAELEKA